MLRMILRNGLFHLELTACLGYVTNLLVVFSAMQRLVNTKRV